MDILKGVRIIDLSELAPGPFCTMHLADLGAEVIKVERPQGDPVWKMIPGVYNALNRNKKSIILNLKTEEGKSLLLKLCEKANVFVESSRPGVAERLGVGYEQIKAVNKDIIYCSISGYGQEGPFRDRPGHDINYCAIAGISSISGDPGGPPDIGSGVPVADFSTSLYACISILSMLSARRGGYLDVSMADCALNFMILRINEYIARGRPEKKKFIGRGGYGIFKAKDGKYVAIAPIEAHFWHRFCQAIDHEGIEKDERFESWVKRIENMDILNSLLDKIFLSRTHDEWLSLLTEVDVPCSTVNFIDDIPNDPYIKGRNQIIEKERDGIPILNVLFPTYFDSERLPLRSLAPSSPGQDTEKILGEMGITSSEIQSLKKKGFVN